VFVSFGFASSTICSTAVCGVWKAAQFAFLTGAAALPKCDTGGQIAAIILTGIALAR
jgi:hypothetical protein